MMRQGFERRLIFPVSPPSLSSIGEVLVGDSHKGPLNNQGEPRLSVFWTGNLLRGVPEVDERGLAEIGNSKEETRGTQFR
jgi:hypothetical protein